VVDATLAGYTNLNLPASDTLHLAVDQSSLRAVATASCYALCEDNDVHQLCGEKKTCLANVQHLNTNWNTVSCWQWHGIVCSV